MKRTIQRILLIVIGINLLPFVCLAQNKYVPGFIINNNQERIEGEVLKQSDIANCQSVSFKEGEHAIKYLPSQIKSWGINSSRLFVSQTIVEDEEEKLVFLEYIVKAKVNLLAYYGVGRDSRFFVQKDNAELRELIFTRSTNSAGMVVENKKYIGVLNIVLSDCIEVYGDISSTTLKINSLKKLITKYNNCVSPDDLVFENTSIETQNIKFSVALAYNIPQYEITNNDEENYDSDIPDYKSTTTNYLSYGIGIAVMIPRVKGLSVNLEAMFAKTEFKFDGFAGPLGYPDYLRFKNTTIAFPIQVRYAYNISKFKPYVCAGYSIVLYAKHEKDHSDQVILFETQHHGWNAGLGLEYQLFKPVSIFFGFKYQSVKTVGYDPPKKGDKSFEYLTLKTSAISFTLGVSF